MERPKRESRGACGSRTVLVFLGCALAGCAVEEASPSPDAAEAPPSTDIIAVEWASGDSGRVVQGLPAWLTDRDGYDNQPRFLPGGGGFLYSSADQDGQVDVWRHDLTTGETTQVTDTPEDEYSPTWLPDGDGFSVVRVEADGRQRLWGFGADGGRARLLLEDAEPVGYHAWVDPQTVALYILGEGESPPTLEIAHLASGERRTVARSIGRCLRAIPGRRRISYVDNSTDEWWIRELDPASGESIALVPTRTDCEDYAWTPEGEILMPCGTELFLWTPGSGEDWERVADLADAGLDRLTRVDVSPTSDRILLVTGRR